MIDFMEKKLYPLKFIPIASRRPWGGNALVTELGKEFTECDENGNESVLGADEAVGESWEIADMGFEDSVVAIETSVKAGFGTVGIYDDRGLEHEKMKKLSSIYIEKGHNVAEIIQLLEI